MLSTNFNNFFKNSFEEINSFFHEIAGPESTQTIRSAIDEISQRILGASCFVYNHFQKIRLQFPWESDQQDLSKKTDLVAINGFVRFNDHLEIPRDTLITIMRELNSSASVLALTSTCKELHKNRISYFTSIPPVLSGLFYKALTNDSLSEWPHSLSCFSARREIVYQLTREDGESNTKKFLNLFKEKSYVTPLFIKTPLVGNHGTKTFEMIMEILKKFPETIGFDFNLFITLPEVQFAKIMALCPRLKYLIGTHPNPLSQVTSDQNLTISFPSTLRTFDFKGTAHRLNINSIHQLLTSCENLETLDLSYWKKPNPETLYNIKFPNTLGSIDLTGANIDDKDLHQILTSCLRLKKLFIPGCSDLTPQAFIDTPFPKTLEQLFLFQNSVNEKGLNNVFTSCQKLQALSIDYCNNFISEDVFNKALTNIPNTITFLFIGNTKINNFGLEQISQTCSKLKLLHLKNTSIDSRGLQTISKYFSNLDNLYLSHCPNISEQDLIESGLRNKKSLTIQF